VRWLESRVARKYIAELTWLKVWARASTGICGLQYLHFPCRRSNVFDINLDCQQRALVTLGVSRCHGNAGSTPIAYWEGPGHNLRLGPQNLGSAAFSSPNRPSTMPTLIVKTPLLPPISYEWTERAGSSYEHSWLGANQNPILWLYSILLFVRPFLQSLSCSLVADKRQYSPFIHPKEHLEVTKKCTSRALQYKQCKWHDE
jgi:hypothetical protein